MPHDVFISYGREDMPLMQQVEKALHEAGLTIWTDRGIAPGSPSWKAEIEKAIQDARCIVVLFSPDSAESRWVRAELDYADAQRKPIYPLLVRGDANKAVPFGFTSYQWIDVRDASQLNAGMERLVAVLKGEQASPAETISETPATASARPRLMITFAASLILAGLVLGLALLSRIPQTTSGEIPTDTVSADAAQAAPTALPTMPPFTVPDGFKKLEGKRTLIGVPESWSTDVDPQVFNDAMKTIAGVNQVALDYWQTIMQGLDTLAVDFLRIQGVVVINEDVGIPLSYPLLEERMRDVYANVDAKGTVTNRGLVDTPAGIMLLLEATSGDKKTAAMIYVLTRGSLVYTIYLTGRYADQNTLKGWGEKIVQTFRVKE